MIESRRAKPHEQVTINQPSSTPKTANFLCRLRLPSSKMSPPMVRVDLHFVWCKLWIANSPCVCGCLHFLFMHMSISATASVPRYSSKIIRNSRRPQWPLGLPEVAGSQGVPWWVSWESGVETGGIFGVFTCFLCLCTVYVCMCIYIYIYIHRYLLICCPPLEWKLSWQIIYKWVSTSNS